MAIFRINKNKNYTTMSSFHLQDKNLSLRAKGLLSIMFSLPEDWNYSVKGLVNICKESVDIVRSTLQELEKFNYLVRTRIQNPNGTFDYIYDIYEQPHSDLPHTEKPHTVEPHTAEPHTEKRHTNKYTNIQNTNIQNTNIQNTNIQNTNNINNSSINNNTHPYPLSCHNTNPLSCHNTNDYDCVEDNKKEKQNQFFEEHTDIKEVIDYWNSKKIIVHRTYTKSLINQIIDKIKLYGKDNILSAIDHYSIIYFDESYKILHYKWTLETFLKQGNCLPDFMDEGIKWQNYLESKSGKKLQEKQFMNSFDYSKFFEDDNGDSNE